jgi:CRISPR-associated protein Csb3
MSEEQVRRRDELGDRKQSSLSPKEKEEKKALDKLWREEPLVFHDPFGLTVDWFMDERAGGDRYKTWAGQQSVIDIARAMKEPIDDGEWLNLPPAEWLTRPGGSGLPFNFDADLGGQASALDIGFSLDPLHMSPRARPLLELTAFIGLQRFRPLADPEENRYKFSLWFQPLTPEIAAVATCGILALPRMRTYEFRLLYRTKYLKSFLSAQPLRGDV